MNCSRCNAPIEENARFCRICGQPVSTSSPNNVIGSPVQPNAMLNDSPTIGTRWEEVPPQSLQQAQPAQWQAQNVGYGAPPAQPTQPAPQSQWGPAPAQPTSLQQGQWMPQNAQQPLVLSPGSMQGAGAQQGQYPPVSPAQQGSVPVRRKRRVWRRLAITLFLLVVLVVGGWFLAARPILHGIAQSQFDQVLSSSVSRILPFPPLVQIPPLPVTETLINNAIAFNHSSSDPVQGVVVHITKPVIASDGSYTGGVQFDFQLYGFACSITGIPMASNGGIVMTHMQVQGILGWIMSPDELTSILNSHFQDAVGRLNRQVSSLTINSQEIDIQFS
jgi:hypothetical protein